MTSRNSAPLRWCDATMSPLSRISAMRWSATAPAPFPNGGAHPALVGLATALAAQGQTRQADSLLAIAITELAAVETTPSSLQLSALQMRDVIARPAQRAEAIAVNRRGA